MKLELTEDQTTILRSALKDYLSNLRAEIVKTEKHEWRVALHREKNLLREIEQKLA